MGTYLDYYNKPAPAQGFEGEAKKKTINATDDWEAYQEAFEKQQEKKSRIDSELGYPTIDEEDQRRRAILNATPISIAGWDTGYTWGDVDPDGDFTAALVGMGHWMSDSYRGIKQFFGYEVELEAQNEKIVNDLYSSEEFGGNAMAGGVVGALADPVGWAAGGVLGKAAQAGMAVSKLSKASKAVRGAVEGAILGGAQAGTGYVDEESFMDSRAKLILAGAGLGGLTGGLVGKYAGKSNALEDVHKFEHRVGMMAAKENVSPAQAASIVARNDPELAQAVLKAQQDYKVVPDLMSARNDALLIEEASKGLTKVTGIPPSQKGAALNSIDKALGLVSTQIKNINKQVWGRLRKYDYRSASRPEYYKKKRDPFASWFVSHSNRKPFKKVQKFSKEETNEIKYLLYNEKFDELRSYLFSRRGQEVVDDFDASLSVYKELAGDLQKIGVLKTKLIDNYWHRAVRRDKFDDFLELIKKEKPSIVKDWEKHLKKLNAISKSNRKHELSEFEETLAFRRFILNEQGDDIHTIGFAKARKKEISREMAALYADPIESMDSYIHRAVDEVEMARFFGEDAYSLGLKNKDKELGVFNLDSAIDGAKMFDGLDVEDAYALKDLLRVRFGHANTKTPDAVKMYKSLINITLLGNPIAAMTQFGDLGVSMYKNGAIRTIKSMFKKKGFDFTDLGLDRHYAEFEDLGGGTKMVRKLNQWQETMLRVSGFNAVDRVGKKVYMQAALEKAMDAVSKKGKRFDRFVAELRESMPESEVQKLVQDLQVFKKNQIPENMTDDLQAYIFSKLADVQPISRSELPQYYLKSPVGKTLFTLKSFMLKQMDIVREDMWGKARLAKLNKDPELAKEAAANIAKYMFFLGTLNFGVDKIKNLATGQEMFQDMPEGEGLLLAGKLLADMTVFRALENFGMNRWTEAAGMRGGLSGYGAEWITPPLPIIDEMFKLGLDIVDGEVDSNPASVSRYIPFAGRWIYQLTKEDDKTQMFAEGGEVVKPESTIDIDKKLDEGLSPQELVSTRGEDIYDPPEVPPWAEAMTHTTNDSTFGAGEGVSGGEVKQRVEDGWSVEDAMSQPATSWDEKAGQIGADMMNAFIDLGKEVLPGADLINAAEELEEGNPWAALGHASVEAAGVAGDAAKGMVMLAGFIGNAKKAGMHKRIEKYKEIYKKKGSDAAYRETGIFWDDLDEAYKFVIKPRDFKVDHKALNSGTVRLGDLVEGEYFDSVFRHAPELKGVEVKYESLGKESGGYFQPNPYGYTGKQQSIGTIVINRDSSIDDLSVKKTLLHELQHSAQTYYDLSRGANHQAYRQLLPPERYNAYVMNRKRMEKVEADLKKMAKDPSSSAKAIVNKMAAKELYEDVQKKFKDEAYKYYMAAAGEMEARWVERYFLNYGRFSPAERAEHLATTKRLMQEIKDNPEEYTNAEEKLKGLEWGVERWTKGTDGIAVTDPTSNQALDAAKENLPPKWENKFGEGTPKFSEGGEVKKAEKLAPGVYQDDDGKLFKVTEDGDLVDYSSEG